MLIFLLVTALQIAPAAAGDPRLYVVGPNDVLAVTVYNQPQLSGKFAVEADGTFAFPLLGRVAAGGLSIRAVEDKVRESLTAGFLTNPQVSVTVDQYRSQQIFVMGEVRQPGSLQFTGSMTLIEALSRAGSTTERAGMEAVIVRSSSGTPATTPSTPGQNASAPAPETIRVNLQNLERGALAQNVALHAGDTVFVPRAETVFVSGQVKTPGEYVIRGAMTVRQAIALAGGVTDRGSTRRIQIIRVVDGKETAIDADLQKPVQAGDTIVVRERFSDRRRSVSVTDQTDRASAELNERTSNQQDVWSDQRICLLATLAVATLIVYGSLVPFDLTWSEAVGPAAWLARVKFSPWSDVSRTDLLVNIAVGMPLGFVLMGALRARRRRGAADAALRVLAVGWFSAIMGTGLELLQVLSPTRNSSWNDVLCEVIGAVIGALIWAVAGRGFIRWLRDAANEPASLGFAARLLELYLPLYLLVRLTPLDARRASELAAGYRDGRNALMPFTPSVDSAFVMSLDLAGNVLLAVPIGALAVLGWTKSGTRRTIGRAILFGFSIVVTVAMAQELVGGRRTEMSTLFGGALGVIVGVAAASAFARDATNSASQSRLSRSWFLLAAAVWTLALIGHAWYPFNFELTSEILLRRLTRISFVPFGFYYWYAIYMVNPLEAVHETLLNFVLAVPLGFFLRLAWPLADEQRMRRLQTATAIGVASMVLLAIELGQTFLPVGFPDVTDLMVGAIGASAGITIATAFMARKSNFRLRPLSSNWPAADDTIPRLGKGRRQESS